MGCMDSGGYGVPSALIQSLVGNLTTECTNIDLSFRNNLKLRIRLQLAPESCNLGSSCIVCVRDQFVLLLFNLDK